MQNTAAEIKTLEFELSGPPQSLVSLAMSASVQGTPCTISVAILDPTSYVVTDVVPIWAGSLDTMHLDDSTDKSIITVTAEHLGIDLNRPSPLYYTNDDQQKLFPGDLFFQYTSNQFDQQIVWPNAWYFHKS